MMLVVAELSLIFIFETFKGKKNKEKLIDESHRWGGGGGGGRGLNDELMVEMPE